MTALSRIMLAFEMSQDRDLYFVHQHKCYIVRWNTDLTAEKTRAHWDATLAHPEFKRDYAVLHDIRGHAIERDYYSSLSLAQHYKLRMAESFGQSRVSFLVDDPNEFGMTRQTATMADLDDHALVTFSERDAKEWIGLPADFVLPYTV